MVTLNGVVFGRDQVGGLAVLPINFTSNFSIHRQGAPALNVTAYLDTTVAYAWAKNVNWFGKKDELSVGFTTKFIHRVFFFRHIKCFEFKSRWGCF